MRSTGPELASTTAAPRRAASAAAVARASSLTGPANGTAIELMARSGLERRPDGPKGEVRLGPRPARRNGDRYAAALEQTLRRRSRFRAAHRGPVIRAE